MTNAIELRDVRFAWNSTAPVLAIPHFAVAARERVFIQGPSGSGKSTLLALIAGVLTPQAGAVRVLGHDLGALSSSRRDTFRAEHVGFIFQLFNLIPYLSVIDNVLLPARFSRARRARIGATEGPVEAMRLLAALGLESNELLNRPVTQISIGQQQRVAAARALIGRPDLIIADEPTSSLDMDARMNFLELLMNECRAAGSTLLFVSHDASLGPRFDRRVTLGEINRVAAGNA